MSYENYSLIEKLFYADGPNEKIVHWPMTCRTEMWNGMRLSVKWKYCYWVSWESDVYILYNGHCRRLCNVSVLQSIL